MVHPQSAERCQCDYDLRDERYAEDLAATRRGIGRLRALLGVMALACAGVLVARGLGALPALPAFPLAFAILVLLVLIGGSTVASSRVRPKG